MTAKVLTLGDVVAEYGPWRVESHADGTIVITPTVIPGVLIRIEIARSLEEALVGLAEKRLQAKA